MTLVGYIYAALLAIITCLGIALWFEKTEVKTLQTQNVAYEVVNQAQRNDLKICSDNTAALKAQDDKITADAQAAVDQAKKDAVSGYALADSIMKRSPVIVTVTAQNKAEYDNGDPKAQLSDFLSSKELINYYIQQNQSKSPKGPQ